MYFKNYAAIIHNYFLFAKLELDWVDRDYLILINTKWDHIN